jgi:hypothetical protein
MGSVPATASAHRSEETKSPVILWRRGMPMRSNFVPAGVHIAADVYWNDRETVRCKQVRILGDDRRGYLLMGIWDFPEADSAEFWFATVTEAKDTAARFGVPVDAWKEVTSVSQLG